MLHAYDDLLMKKTALFLALAFTAGAVYAQATDNDLSKSLSSDVAIPTGYATQLTPAELAHAQQAGELITRSSLNALQGDQAKQFAGQAATMARRVDDIADQSIGTQRDDVLKFLGINPQAGSSMYYFVSWSMPLEMLRSYAAEAMWTGGFLVFRGIPADMGLKDFILGDLKQLVYGKGASAAISLDPRLFDAYEVKVVPTIVFTSTRANMSCDVARSFVGDNKQNLQYKACPPVDQEKYWKISGAVTSDYALREFIADGAPGADTYLEALKKGQAAGEQTPVLQQGFKGEWKDALTPADVQAMKEGKAAIKAP
jgi:type-F conjugative transfer system pilin assembly protein TrbC